MSLAIGALIFDVDGTLAETEELHRQAFNETFSALGLAGVWHDPALGWHWSVATYGRLLGTTGGKERIAAYLRHDLGVDPEPHRDRIAVIHGLKTQRFAELMASQGIGLRAGIAELFALARSRNLAVAVATTTSAPNVDAVSRAAFGKPASDLFDVVAAGDEIGAKKPSPDVYLLALQRLGMPAAACVAFEDSRNGLLAAQRAGLRCVVSPSLYTAADDFSGADLLVPDFAAALPLVAVW